MAPAHDDLDPRDPRERRQSAPSATGRQQALQWTGRVGCAICGLLAYKGVFYISVKNNLFNVSQNMFFIQSFNFCMEELEAI